MAAPAWHSLHPVSSCSDWPSATTASPAPALGLATSYWTPSPSSRVCPWRKRAPWRRGGGRRSRGRGRGRAVFLLDEMILRDLLGGFKGRGQIHGERGVWPMTPATAAAGWHLSVPTVMLTPPAFLAAAGSMSPGPIHQGCSCVMAPCDPEPESVVAAIRGGGGEKGGFLRGPGWAALPNSMPD